ncbi:hypothetical protein [Paenibacillus sp. MMS18-CY102]|uniref:hypothetical protein n=1 Tax=Paenibacillus sp. MMS18-CY102 TaxID=2682849 RepID=UPI0013656307|nr:hypothetical protein [Paenibacillus sp. MMS18-CY102]MWC30810.1 hypothetical protein [Paenibacillus sp. MMS18-CY102]
MSNEELEYDENELIEHLAAQTKVPANTVRLVLQYEQKFIDNAKPNARGEVDIDSDELVDYILKQRDVKLDELTLETILDAEMDYLVDKGYAEFED